MAERNQEPRVFRVGELTRLIRGALEREFGEVWVEGEISNLTIPASGHAYFTLKDEEAQLSAVMWRGDLKALAAPPRDGLLARLFGRISVYERRGQYQMIVRRLEAAGQGALQAAFERLKKKLEAEGLFAPARKRPLPFLPRHLGIVTSPTGAALRDILKILDRRYPNLHIVIAPTRVQGAGAAEEIAAALDLLNARGGLDVLIVGRGGGSLEELWCFNEEVVARAIVRSRIPVISAVGHEIDFTISDFVADLRAPTPSAAAELVVENKARLEESVRQQARRLARALRERLADFRHRLRAAAESYVFREPGHRLRAERQRIDGIVRRQRQGLQGRWREAQQTTDELHLRLGGALRNRQALWRQLVSGLDAQLRALSPLAVLERGYSITRTAAGAVARSAAELRPGARVVTRLARGTFDAEVIKTYGQEEK